MEVFTRGNYDAVIHFAGLKAVGESTEQPLHYYENNVGDAELARMYACLWGEKKIVFSSSATVYGVQESPKCEGVDADGCRDYKPPTARRNS